MIRTRHEHKKEAGRLRKILTLAGAIVLLEPLAAMIPRTANACSIYGNTSSNKTQTGATIRQLLQNPHINEEVKKELRKMLRAHTKNHEAVGFAANVSHRTHCGNNKTYVEAVELEFEHKGKRIELIFGVKGLVDQEIELEGQTNRKRDELLDYGSFRIVGTNPSPYKRPYDTSVEEDNGYYLREGEQPTTFFEVREFVPNSQLAEVKPFKATSYKTDK